MTEVGEYIAGAWLHHLGGCDFIDYNVRPREGGLAGLDEFDVIGFHFASRPQKVYICQVTTHISGMAIMRKGHDKSIEHVRTQLDKQMEYANRYLKSFSPTFMLWSPRVRKGILRELEKLPDLELVVNERYSKFLHALRQAARTKRSPGSNPAFRMLQILEASKPHSVVCKCGHTFEDHKRRCRVALWEVAGGRQYRCYCRSFQLSAPSSLSDFLA